MLLSEAESVEDAEEYVRKRRLPFPVLHDPKGLNAKGLGFGGIPKGLLLDTEGKVVWQGSLGPADKAEADACEAAIRREIEKRNPAGTLTPR